MKRMNPLINVSFSTHHNAIPFQDIQHDDFIPAVKKAINDANKCIAEITASPKTDFHSVVKTLELSLEYVEKITGLFSNLLGAESDDSFKELAGKFLPLVSVFMSKVYTNSELFNKINDVYKQSESIKDMEDRRLTEYYTLKFVRNGAELDDQKKKKLMKIDRELASLYPAFTKNLLGATNAYTYHTTEYGDIEGLPPLALKAAEEDREKNGLDKGWLITLQAPSIIPALTYINNRTTRETLYKAYASRCLGGDYDNRDIIRKILFLRQKRAELLGYKNHADYTLKERMAETPETVFTFLITLADHAMPVARKEIEEIKVLAKIDGIDTVKPWDLSYYSEKIKEDKFAFKEDDLRPYFKMENVIDGLFIVAEKLYGITFKKVHHIPVYHSDVVTYEVYDEDGSFLGLFYTDLYPRKTKSSGAWMTTYASQGLSSKNTQERPHVSIVANVTPSTKDSPSLLQYSEVKTLFHEFGHALHGLLSACKWKTLSSPNVYWDFVELPSQIMENWTLEKESLSLFARHYETGTPIPDELLDKMKEANNYYKGNMNLRQIRFGLLDMNWHTRTIDKNTDILAFEEDVLRNYQLTETIPGTCISTAFSHIFAGGYAAGYYSYKWAEVLEADAFNLFQEKGIFNRNLAKSFRKNILEKGNSDHPMVLYKSFRGQEPDPQALLKRDGLIPVKES